LYTSFKEYGGAAPKDTDGKQPHTIAVPGITTLFAENERQAYRYRWNKRSRDTESDDRGEM